MSNARILIIPDMHMPYCHPDLWKFLRAIKRKFNPDRAICLGDEIDGHAISFHEHNPDLPSAGPELEQAIRFLKPLYRLFPTLDVLESNHGSLILRKALAAGLPRRAIKSYREILDAPAGWKWHFDLRIRMSNGIDLYLHHGKSATAAKMSLQEGCCTVEGHFHTKFHVTYWRNSSALNWGMHCGYLADHNSLAQAYAKSNMQKGIVGAAMILNGQPLLIPMILSKSGRWVGKL